MDLERLCGGGRRLLAPQLVDQAVAAERLAAVQEEQREYRAELAASQVDLLAPVEGLERAEDVKVHAQGTEGRGCNVTAL